MTELIASFFVVLISAGILGFATNDRFSSMERKFLWLAFLAHIISSVAQVFITRDFYGGGDMFLYYNTGVKLAALTRFDFAEYFPMVVSIVFRGEPPIGMDVVGAGSSTGAMSGLTALMLLVTFDSLFATCIIYGMLAMSGQVAMYATMRTVFSKDFHKRLLIAALLVPSVVFWSSSILKEPLAVAGVGWAVWGFQRFAFTKYRFRGLITAAPAFFLISVFKPYILFPLAIGLGIWFYWTKTNEDRGKYALLRKFVYLSISIGVTILAVDFLGKKYPHYAVENVTENTARLQSLYYNQSGGSTFQYGESTEDRQVWYAPMALVSSLFRPFIFEVHNPTSAVNALEMFYVTMLVLTILFRSRARARLRFVPRSPAMMFMLTFVVVFAVAAGLGAPNLGSLSRYRIPFMPFYFMFLLVIIPAKVPTRRKLTVRKPLKQPSRTA